MPLQFSFVLLTAAKKPKPSPPADLLVRAGVTVTLASANDDGSCLVTGSRGIRIMADVPLGG